VYQRANKIIPNNRDFYYSIGVIQETLGKNTKAVEAYKKSIEIKPKFDS
jgi:tetratricopeptide (TPR) repeat protein